MNPYLEAILKNLTNQLSNITTRLDQFEARAPRGTHEDQVDPEPELEFGTPINPRRAYHEPAYEPNPRRPNQGQMAQDDRSLRNIRLEAPTFDGTLDP